MKKLKIEEDRSKFNNPLLLWICMKEVTDKRSYEELESEIKRIVHNINDNPTNEDDLINSFTWMGIGEKDLQEWKSSYLLFVDTKESIIMRERNSPTLHMFKRFGYIADTKRMERMWEQFVKNMELVLQRWRAYLKFLKTTGKVQQKLPMLDAGRWYIHQQ